MFKYLIFLLIPCLCWSQSYSGNTGLIRIPNARVQNDGELRIGTSYIPPGYHKRTDGIKKGLVDGRAGLYTFITLGVGNRIEFMFRYSHTLNLPINIYTRYFPDRMSAIKLKIFDEKPKMPAILIGAHDITGLLDSNIGVGGEAPNYSSLYIVGSKNFIFHQLQIESSIGYGINNWPFKSKELKGLFGGVEVNLRQRPYSFLIDFDGFYINVGIKTQLLRRINILSSYYPNYGKFGSMISYRFNLK